MTNFNCKVYNGNEVADEMIEKISETVFRTDLISFLTKMVGNGIDDVLADVNGNVHPVVGFFPPRVMAGGVFVKLAKNKNPSADMALGYTRNSVGDLVAGLAENAGEISEVYLGSPIRAQKFDRKTPDWANVYVVPVVLRVS